MAVTITRTPWIDDDGSGTTGSVLNNAVKTELYNQIDAALAAGIPATGGMVTGDLLFSPDATYDIGKNAASRPRDLFVSRAAKIGAWNLPATGEISTGVIGAGNTYTYLAPALLLLGTAGSASNQVVAFQNANSTVGNIVTSGSSTAYNTTSDARLKTDDGLATDLSALRAVQVHDFRWTSSGTPDRGIFAQEIHALYPRAVTAGSDGADLSRPWMTDYAKLVPDLIVGWQHHDARLAALEARVGV